MTNSPSSPDSTGAPVPAFAGPAPDADRRAAIHIDRASTELRRGRPVALWPAGPGDRASAASSVWLVSAVETLAADELAHWLATGLPVRLLLSAERVASLGREGAQAPHSVVLPRDIELSDLSRWAAVTGVDGPFEGLPPAPLDPKRPSAEHHPAAQAALFLAKRARLIPAFIVLELPAEQAGAWAAWDPLALDLGELQPAGAEHPQALRRVSDARVPLGLGEDCTLIVFRETDGDAEHLAIIVGEPATGSPVPVRLHSACLTGDLLDSLRCDCGPQLQRAVQRLGETGGVLLYLAQEGRGTGLANKLRAYRLQDQGLDTLQADRYLGFREDERQFGAAAAMLQSLGYTRIRLMTNNPQKIDALREAGIEVVDRLPLLGPVNDHNQRYLQTKRAAGHLGAD